MSDIFFEIVKHVQEHGTAPEVNLELTAVPLTATSAEREAGYAKASALAKSLNRKGREISKCQK